MSTRCFTGTVVTIGVVSFCAVVSAGTYSLTVAGERLEFVAQPERGYVVKLAPDAGGVHALAGISALDADGAREIRGLDRRGVWTVENNGPAGRNEETLRSLQVGGRVAYAASLFSSNGETVAIIPEIVVRVKPGIVMEQVQALAEATGCTIRKRMEFTMQEYLLEVLGPDAEAVFTAVERLGKSSEVEWACPNTAFRPKLCGQSPSAVPTPSGQLHIASAGEDPNTSGVFPNDEYFPMQWHLHNTGQSGGTPGADIRAPQAWEITTGDPNIIVAVIDSGVDSRHPDLMNNLVPGYDYVDNDEQPDPQLDYYVNAHGTACAGLIAAQGDNSIGVTGVTWNCRLMPIRVDLEDHVPESDTATALRRAASDGADIFSNSWADDIPLPIVHSAIVDVTRLGGMGRHGKGCVLFFSSGNGSGSIDMYPARYSEAIVVGATDHDDRRWDYSDYGPDLDIVAPSGAVYDKQGQYGFFGSIWTTDLLGDPGINNRDPAILDYTDKMAGTSAACPIAAGVAALILSIEPNLTNDEVRHFLERSAKDLGDPGRDDYYGWGRVDARAALDMVLAHRCDLNHDWKVDEQDLAILNAAIDANDLSADIAPAAKRDGKVDGNDLALLRQYMGTVIPELGLIAHWKLDESEGDIAHDGINHRDGTLHGDAIWQPEGGIVGGALELNGTDAYVSTPFILNPYSGSFSVFMWVKGGAPGEVILSQKNGANWLLTDSGGALMTELKMGGTSGRTLASPVTITDGNWHRIGLVRDGTSRILCVDDVEAARDTQSALGASIQGLYMGADSKLTAGRFWSGLIDDVRIYDRAVKP
jgi:subtilisin family serine protease